MGAWWYGHTYPIETDRGQDDTEDLFVPGRLVLKSVGKAMVTLWASLDEPAELLDWDEEVNRRREQGMGEASPTMRRLLRAADDFVVARKRPDDRPGTSIIAGYPWFADWGRDTMIALPGLLLTPRRFEEAAQVLTLFAQYVSEGMIPNRFDDYTSEPSYNTVDASLWFVQACFEYLRQSEDKGTFERELRPACRAVVEGYRKGTRYNIHMEADGLIAAGDQQTQLTWMDAKCGGVAFTPRHGKAVEINALWYNALKLLGEDGLAEQVAASFVKAFWYNPFRGLYDVVRGTGGEGFRDSQLRPNQIFAVSLPHSPLNHDQQHAVVEVVRRELLTVYGLRTLNRADPNYGGQKYCGPQFERDRAYHNGIVWPWLIGPFLEAYLRVHEFSADARRQARVWLQPLIDHMNSGCVGQIAECFTGDEPHRPVACPAQAWSVAEVLRLGAVLGV
jgi:predicted glycogen debranching enzyme